MYFAAGAPFKQISKSTIHEISNHFIHKQYRDGIDKVNETNILTSKYAIKLFESLERIN